MSERVMTILAGPRRKLPDQLAYIYFTSGSTGEPKGALCEHAGLLNHPRTVAFILSSSD